MMSLSVLAAALTFTSTDALAATVDLAFAIQPEGPSQT